MLKTPLSKTLSVYLIAALIVLSLPSPGWAMFIPSACQPTSETTVELSRIQAVLESTLLSQRLADYGLSPEETLAKINALSDAQIHDLASRMDSLQAGGDGLGALVFLLLVAVVVVVVLQATGHRVIIK